MIKYRILCDDCGNSFDSWFASSKEYEKLKKQKFINCHVCNSLNVQKDLMSPNLAVTKSDTNFDRQKDKFKKVKKKLIEYQRFIKNNFDYVGENFAHEARAIHYKEKKSKGIYGKATLDDLKELKEEGIESEMVPWIKDNTN